MPAIILRIAGWLFSKNGFLTVLCLVAAAGLFLAGWQARDWKCDAAAQKLRAELAEAQTRILQDQLQDLQTRLEIDARQAEADAAAQAALNQKLEELTNAVENGSDDCLGRSDTDRLRQLWK